MKDSVTIELKGLAKSYGREVWAVHPIEGILPDGAVGLLGPNGAGKTTFLSMITLFLEPSTGDFTLFGLSARDAANHRILREQMGVLPQDARLPLRQPSTRTLDWWL